MMRVMVLVAGGEEWCNMKHGKSDRCISEEFQMVLLEQFYSQAAWNSESLCCNPHDTSYKNVAVVHFTCPPRSTTYIHCMSGTCTSLRRS